MKKIVCLCLVAIMLMSALVSCNDASNVDDVVSTNNATTEDITELVTEEITEDDSAIKEYDLSKFAIVYDELYNLKIATDFRDKIESELNVSLKVRKASKSNESELEFVVGNTPREVSSLCFDMDNPKYLTAKGIVCNGGKIQMLGIDSATVNASVEYLLKNNVNKDTLVVSVPEQGECLEVITHESIDIPVKADESYVRFVTNNILDQAYTPSWDRLLGLVGAYVYLDADIYTLQEVGKKWHSEYKLTERMEWLGYALVTDNEKVACPIYYRTDRFGLVEGGYGTFDTSKLAETTEKNYAWACLEEKATGKKLIVVSTHLIANGANATAETKANRNEHRDECARQLLALVSELQNKYGNAPALVAGDFNSRATTNTYSIMSGVMNSARDNCEKKVNMNYNTENSLGKLPKQTDECIDHVFYSKSGITAKHFETVVSPYTYVYADHVPALLDFELN